MIPVLAMHDYRRNENIDVPERLASVRKAVNDLNVGC